MKSDDDIVNEFSLCLESSPSARVEDFLGQSTTKIYVDVRRLLVAEMACRLRNGESLDPQEFHQRFPDLAPHISGLLAEAADAVEIKLTDSSMGGDTAELPLNPSRETLGSHELLEVIGRGGMGIVYRARQTKLNRIVAVKTIVTGKHNDPVASERFRREAEATARLSHSGIVPVYEIGDEDGVLFFSMAFIPGLSLSEYLKDNTLTPHRAAEVVCAIAEAVQYAHDAGVVHRDLKPANILMDELGHPKIVDFGLAQMVDRDGLTMTGATVGTPSYMSPEQASGLHPVGPVSDVYSLGAILYACLSGTPPFRGPSAMATLKMVIYERPTPLRQLRHDLPKDLETICEKCLEKHPSSRFATAAELAEELRRFMNGHPILARPVPFWVRSGRWCRRNPVVAGLGTVVAVTLICGISVSTYFALLAEGRATTAENATASANEQSKLAKEQSQLALKSLQTIIHSVQQRLKDVPEAREVRRELLKQALEDLQVVSGSYIAQGIVDRETAKALTDLAQLYTEIGDEAGEGTVELSDSHFRHAVDIYLQLLDESPDEEELMKTALTTMVEYGDTAREYTQFEKAVWAHKQAYNIASNWFERSQDDPDAQLALLRSSEALGEALLRSGKLQESREFILVAEQLIVDYVQKYPTIDAYENYTRCFCTVGDMYRISRQFDMAEAAYQKMCRGTAKLMELQPGNPKWLDDQSADLERLGDLEMSRKNYPKAREHFEESLRMVELYVADDPSNLFRLQQSTWAYQKLAAVCKAQGDTDRETWARSALSAIRKRLKGRE